MTLEMISHAPASDQPARHTPLLFVHGFWHAAWAWEETFLPYFAARGYHAHAVSMSGHGGSPGNFRWIRSPRVIRDIRSAAESLPRPPILIGHSMGGYVVQKVLENNPHIPAAVLIAPVPHFGVLPATLRFATRHPLKFLKINATLNMKPAVETPALARKMLFSPNTPAHTLEKTFPRLQSDSYFLYLDMLMLNLPRPRRINTPMLVVGGEHDGIFPPREVHATARRYNTEARIFPDTGHNLMHEPVWQSVADHILEWLTARDL